MLNNPKNRKEHPYLIRSLQTIPLPALLHLRFEVRVLLFVKPG